MKALCNKCMYVSPTMLPFDTQYRRYFCTKHQFVTIDPVTGETFNHFVLCSTVNSKGECPDFAKGESERLNWQPEGGDGIEGGDAK